MLIRNGWYKVIEDIVREQFLLDPDFHDGAEHDVYQPCSDQQVLVLVPLMGRR